ncbi:MAG: hypothetical protein J6Y30_07205 [Treponema sp.]|nr:hypothetical protein [Treponema sp.]
MAKETGKFSPENLRDKMPRRAFYPAFQGSAFRLHCLTATRSAPFQSGLGSFCCTPQRRHSRTLPFRRNQAPKKMKRCCQINEPRRKASGYCPLRANKIRTDFHLPCQKLKSAWMRGLAACRIAQRFCNTQENPWRDFHLPCQPVKSHGWRLSSMQNCIAILQSLEKSMEGFFQGKSYARLEWRQGCLQPVAVPAREWSAKARNHGKRVTKGPFSRLQQRNEWQSKKNYRPKKYRLHYNFDLNQIFCCKISLYRHIFLRYYYNYILKSFGVEKNDSE